MGAAELYCRRAALPGYGFGVRPYRPAGDRQPRTVPGPLQAYGRRAMALPRRQKTPGKELLRVLLDRRTELARLRDERDLRPPRPAPGIGAERIISRHKKASLYGKEEPYRDACNYIAFIFQTEQTPKDR